MKHPVFFSFASDAKALAERLKSRFRDDLVYMYTRTGVDGDSFPTEILSELRQCALFVVFWSAAYVANDPKRPWCRRELLTACKRIEQRNLSRFLIIQTDATALDQVVVDPDSDQSVDALKALREDGRAFSFPPHERAIEQRLSLELAQLDQLDHPLLPRTGLQQQLRSVLATGNAYAKTPVVFVNGFHGSGRRTLIRSVMGGDFRHLTEYTVSLDSADGPEDLLRVIWGDVLHKSREEQRQMMRDIEQNPTALKRYFAQLGTQLVANRSYVLVSKDEATDVSEVLPYWAAEYFGLLHPAVQPLIFCTVGRGLPQFMQRLIPNGGEVDVPTLEDPESVQLVNMVIGAVDASRVDRWRTHVDSVVEAGANNPKLIVDIVRVAAKRSSLDFLKRDIDAQAKRFDERVQRLVEWAWDSVREDAFAVQVLDIINLLGVAHIESLQEIFGPESTKVGNAVFHLIQVGLVEHLSESTYRIPRALARKLNLYVAGALPRARSMDLLRRFARSVDIPEGGSSGVALTNRIQVKLAAEAPIPDEDLVFVTTSMLFKAGWQRYRLGQYSAALPLLRRSFNLIHRVQDDSTRLEVVRFFALAAAREFADEDVEAARRFLGKPGSFHHRLDEKVRAMSLFIQAFAYKCKSQFGAALPLYEEALDALPEGSFNDGQRSQMLNEAVQCILRVEPLDSRRALEMAKRSCAIRETPNTMDVLLRALLAQTYFDDTATQEEIHSNLTLIDHWEARLKEKCEAGNLSFYVRRLVDRLEAEAVDAVVAPSIPFPGLDLSQVVAVCHEAFMRFQDDALLWRKWDLMLLDEANRDWEKLHAEASSYLRRGSLNRMGRGNAARIRILTFDMSDPLSRREAKTELEKYRADGTLPKAVASDIRRHLDADDLRQSRVLGPSLRRGLRLQWDD